MPSSLTSLSFLATLSLLSYATIANATIQLDYMIDGRPEALLVGPSDDPLSNLREFVRIQGLPESLAQNIAQDLSLELKNLRTAPAVTIRLAFLNTTKPKPQCLISQYLDQDIEATLRDEARVCGLSTGHVAVVAWMMENQMDAMDLSERTRK